MDWLNELLKEHIAEDKIDSVMAEVKKQFPEHAVPKEQYNKKVEALGVAEGELKTAREQMESTNEQLKNLSSGAEDLEALKKSLSETETAYNEYKTAEETRTAELRTGLLKDFALEKALISKKADMTMLDLLKQDYDMEKLTLGDNNELSGFDDLFETARQKRPNAYATVTTTDPSGEPQAGDPANNDSNLRSYFGLE